MVLKDGAKMSKNKGNTVDPQQLVDKYGADTVRLFMMATAPPEQALEWSDDGRAGCVPVSQAFGGLPSLDTVESGLPGAITEFDDAQRDLRLKTHQTIAKVSDDIGRRYKFNTAVAATMELMNSIGRFDDASEGGRAAVQEALESIVLLLAPIVPHICHDLWRSLGHEDALIHEPWPEADAAAMARDTVELVVQVNGKLRARIEVPTGAAQTVVEQAALQDSNVQRFVAGKAIRKVIVVPGRLVNVVV